MTELVTSVNFLLGVLLSYLLGSMSGSLLIGRFQGVDIRTQGSGNAGATNALRTRGWRFALGVLLIDVGKGMLAALALLPLVGLASRHQPLAGSCFVLAAAVGHVYPIWHGFRGGKGAGTLFGGFLLLSPASAAVALLVWLLALTKTGYVGPSTVLAGFALPFAASFLGTEFPVLTVMVFAALLLAFTHRSNLQRLLQGNEARFQKAKLW